MTDLGALGGVGDDHGLRVFVECVQSLLDGFLVVVHSAGGLTSLHQPLGHGLVTDLEVEDVGAGSDLLLKLLLIMTPCSDSF